MKQRLVLILAVFAIVGVLLAWGCVSLLGILAAFSSEHRFFGLSVHTVLILEDFLAWVPLSLFTGFFIGSVLQRNAVAVSTYTAASAFLWLLISGAEFWWSSGSLVQAMQTIAFAFLTGGILLFLATPCGAFIALRRRRPNPSIERT
jgi:hypothetical protein